MKIEKSLLHQRLEMARSNMAKAEIDKNSDQFNYWLTIFTELKRKINNE